MSNAAALKAIRAYLLYGGIAGCGTALAWPKDALLDWRFWTAISLSVLTAWKALGTKPTQEPPQTDSPNP